MTDDMRPATLEEIATSLRYSLRFGATGKAHGKRAIEDRETLATWVAQHLLMSNFVILVRPPGPQHGPGNCGARPTGAVDA